MATASAPRTADAVSEACAHVDEWSASGDEIGVPLGLDEETLVGVIRRAAANLSTKETAVAFGLHLGAALARIVDDPSFGAGTAQCRYALSRDGVTVTCERAMGHTGEHAVTLGGVPMTGAEAARRMGGGI